MLTVEQLIKESRDPRLERLPLYARDLIRLLAHRLQAEHSYARAVKEKAKEEVSEARSALTAGPEDSDTFLPLASSSILGYSDEEEQRPLGKGTEIEFRRPGGLPGDGLRVRLEDGKLDITSAGELMLLPVSISRVRIDYA